MNDAKNTIRHLMEMGLSDGVFPGGVVLWGTGGEVLGEVAVGHLRTTPPQPWPPVTPDTVFDLASLTKPLVTGALTLLLISEGRFTLETPLEEILLQASGTEAGKITVREILSHSGGLCAWAPLYEKISSKDPDVVKRELMSFILALLPVATRGSKAIYSDFGFILLGMALEEVTGHLLETLYRTMLARPLGLREADYLTPDSDLLKKWTSGSLSIASTEVDTLSGEPLTGVVHDEHARLMGGVSGHAGLFGSAHAVWQLSRIWMDGAFLPPEWVSRFRSRQEPLEWALGWDTPTYGSSSGRFMTPEAAIGHLGYAGTSVWMDWKKDRVIVLLTNRVHPVRTNNRIREFRPILHDTVVTAAFFP